MASTVGTRPNHYETLGLKPTASGDEIARAFAREMSLFRPRAFGGLAQVTIAHETLRDPASRRAYDASRGISPAAKPRQSPLQGLPPLQLPADRPIQPEPSAEPRLPAFIAASLREPVNLDARDPSPTPVPRPEQPRGPEQGAKAATEPRSADNRPPHHADEQGWRDVEDGPIAWRRAVAAAGALVAAVVLLGAWAGWQTGNDIESSPLEPAMTAMLPPAKPLPAITAPPPGPDPSMVEALPARPKRAAAAAPRAERAASPPQPVATEEPLPADSQSEQIDASEIATGQAVVESPPVEVTVAAAKLPLPDSVVARTIERIGYSCGQVASTSPVEGAGSGVYKVTCTSGYSYRAAPVRGRYHFRRLGRQ
jgi:hypothetical protein